MYNMIEEVEPMGFNTVDKYLYFDESQDHLMEQELPDINEVMNHMNFQAMTNKQFSNLLLNYDLTPAAKLSYQTKFQKARRIYKRDKAKTRATGSCLKLLQPLTVETSESVGIKQEGEVVNDKEEEQKKRKRISAQMSRDKKKVYIQQIETQNQALKKKCRELEAENKQLKISSKTLPSESKKGSLKSWLIMSLIVLSLQKQKQIGTIEPFYNHTNDKQFIDGSYLFKSNNGGYLDAKDIIEEYQRQPVEKRVGDLEKVAHFTELNKEEEVMKKLRELELFSCQSDYGEIKSEEEGYMVVKLQSEEVKLQRFL